MAPLIALGVSFLPDLARLLFGDHAGRITESVGQVVKAVTGTDQPAEAKAKLDADPALVSQLRIELAKIAAEAEKARLEAKRQQRQVELDSFRAQLQDTQGARRMTADLAKSGSFLANGPAIVSSIVTLGFFGLIAFLAVRLLEGKPISLDQNAAAILNIAIGAMVAGFTAVINFWLGSSSGSRGKDAVVERLAGNQVDIVANAVDRAERTREIAAARDVARFSAAPVAARAAAPPLHVKRQAFQTAVQLVLEKEGGFANHPRDKGGMTNMGITFRTYARFHDMNPDQVTERMMRDLQREEAIEIYRMEYWAKAGCDKLPPGVDLGVFDFGVTAGPRTAARKLQEVVGVKQDGSIGEITVAAVEACGNIFTINRFADRRIEFYRSLPDFDVFGRGWTSRTNEIRAAALAIAEAAARTSEAA